MIPVMGGEQRKVPPGSAGPQSAISIRARHGRPGIALALAHGVTIALACAACARVTDEAPDTGVTQDASQDDLSPDTATEQDPDGPADAPDGEDPAIDLPADHPGDTGIDVDVDVDVDTDCVPACGGRDCGLDPFCGISCGTCTTPQVCNTHGECVDCAPDCTGRACGPDPICSSSCGSCTPPDTCDVSGACVPPGCPPPLASCSNGSEGMEGCSNARTIGRPGARSGFAYSGNTCYGSYNFDESGCGDYGSDNVLRIYMLAGESISASVDSSWDCTWESSWWSITLKVYGNSGCSDTSCATMLRCEDSAYSQSLSFSAPGDGWYFIVVDSWSAFDEGDYNLQVSLVCLNADCDC